MDGVHPRQLAELPDRSLEYLAELFQTWEMHGQAILPNPTLMVRMLPKPTRGFRPIGLFPTLIRVWGKLTQLLKEWTRENEPDAAINMAAGRSTGDATWRHKMLAEQDKKEGRHKAEALWDVQKCFEHVDAALLVASAEEHNYPVELGQAIPAC